jgi:hypothetical protein
LYYKKLIKNIKQQQHELEMKMGKDLCKNGPEGTKPVQKIPSMSEMMNMFQGLAEQNKSLAVQNESLRQDVEELKKGGIKKKALKPLEWLQTNIQPATSFEQWQNELCIEKTDIYLIFDKGYIKGNVNILQRLLLIKDEPGGDGPPICAFARKRVIYQYNGNKWETMNMEVFTKLMRKINKNLLNHFSKWADDNDAQIRNINSSNKYLLNFSNIMGGGKSMKENIPKIYYQWRNSIKKNLKDFA